MHSVHGAYSDINILSAPNSEVLKLNNCCSVHRLLNYWLGVIELKEAVM